MCVCQLCGVSIRRFHLLNRNIAIPTCTGIYNLLLIRNFFNQCIEYQLVFSQTRIGNNGNKFPAFLIVQRRPRIEIIRNSEIRRIGTRCFSSSSIIWVLRGKEKKKGFGLLELSVSAYVQHMK